MDHKAFLKSLSPAERARLTQLSDAAGLAHFTLHLGLIVALSAYVWAGLWLWPLAMLGAGIAMVFLFTLLHETVHFTPFRTRWINLGVGLVCGVLLGLGPLWFRYFHLAHHRFTQDRERDPELAQPKPATRRAYLWHLTGLPTWRDQGLTLIKNAFFDVRAAYIPDRRMAAIRIEARLILAAYVAIATASVLFAWTWVFWLWIGPLLLGQPFLRAYLLAEHAQCDHGTDMFANTRTTLTTALIRFLAWNMPYHAEHHACPTVPFHALPRLHEMAREHLGITEDGYVRFHRSYAAKLPNGQE